MERFIVRDGTNRTFAQEEKRYEILEGCREGKSEGVESLTWKVRGSSFLLIRQASS